ncbi:phosphotriesterase family protein [Streptomyces sp. CA2R101]|uniref:phosphotriesterase family protein n=1 Tax=Streptomyces sp. CA2R101 TaxID=3120152 RepID=UPI00300AD7D9
MSDLLQTVSGPLPASAVRGPVLAHEHLALDLTRGAGGAATLTPGHRAAITEELASLRTEFGLGLLVELTCRGMGRDVASMARIAADSGVAVIAATGWYYEPFRPGEPIRTSAERLAGTLVGEIERGCGGSGIRPGVIGEVGSHGDAPSEPEARTLTAAALAAAATGLSVATHARFGRGGLAQLELLTAAGLPPHRVSIGHQDLLDESAVHRELAAAGAYLAFDTVGKESYRSDGVRLRLLLALLESGYADRVLLSCDVSRHGYLLSEGGTGYGHLFRSFLPRLRAAGVDEELVDRLTRRNPLRFLTGRDGADEGPADGGGPVRGR